MVYFYYLYPFRDYLDFLWLPVGWFAVHKGQRWKTVAFIAACLMTLRTQVELMDRTGHDAGFLPFLQGPSLQRGMITYAFIIGAFLILAYLSPKTQGIIFFSAALSVYVMAFCMSMVIMIL